MAAGTVGLLTGKQPRPGPSSPDLPPLSHAEAKRVLARMREVVGNRDVVLIGGQAVSLWVAQLEDRLTDTTAELVASKDIDFQGDSAAFQRATELLDGEGRVPRFDELPPMSGVAIFRDNDGWARHLDFLPQPYGLKRDEVVAHAIEVTTTGPDGDELSFHVMHPLHVLESRICNASLPSKRTDLAWRQLRAAIECARAFHVALLDLATEDELEAMIRRVLKYNERIFRMAAKEIQVGSWVVAQEIDIFRAAVTADERLPRMFTERRLPQMRAILMDATSRSRHVD